MSAVLTVVLAITSWSIAAVPVLHPVGPAEIVWSKKTQSCNATKWHGGVLIPCEEPDSMPIAWHNPKTKMTTLISSTDCTIPFVGANLSVPLVHECHRRPFIAGNETTPWSYDNHQWLQSVRMFANGSGVAMVHNEFHGEQLGNLSYCSFNSKTDTGQCILWSTDLGGTSNGGDLWEVTHTPLITLPRKYVKDAPIEGYGELGSIMYQDGFYYTIVSRHYNNGTGSGPSDTVGNGSCIFRTNNPTNASTYRGWNGSAWSTNWVNPYKEDITPSQLRQHTCQAISQGSSRTVTAHLNPKKFGAAFVQGMGDWPTHVLTGWPPGRTTAMVDYYFPPTSGGGAVDGDAPFTVWEPAPAAVRLDEWMDPCTIGGGRYEWMYPNLIDHSSPFELSQFGDEHDISDGLSYGLVGNHSLYLYAVLSREYIVRFPMAWFSPGQPLPTSPYPPSKPPALNPTTCTRFKVVGAPKAGVDGIYTQVGGDPASDGTHVFKRDDNNELYHFQATWKLGIRGKVVYYEALQDVKSRGDGVPVTSWGGCNSNNFTVTCVDPSFL